MWFVLVFTSFQTPILDVTMPFFKLWTLLGVRIYLENTKAGILRKSGEHYLQ